MGLKELDLHLTNKCTLRCNHCVFSSSERKFPEMDTEQVSRLIDDFSSIAGSRGILNIFGGEVLLREDVPDIIREIRKRGLSVGITTNCHVPESAIEAILKQDIQRITADLDGSTPETHEQLRGNSKNFNNVVSVLREAISRGIFTTVNSVLHTENAHQVEDILELCRSIGVSGLAFYYLTPTGRGMALKDKCLDAIRWMKIKERVQNWIKENTPQFTVCWEEAYESTPGTTAAAWRCEKEHEETIFIRCDGEVYSCALLEGTPNSMGNVINDKLSAILKRRKEKAFDRSHGCPALAFPNPDPRTTPEGIKLGCPYNYQLLNEAHRSTLS